MASMIADATESEDPCLPGLSIPSSPPARSIAHRSSERAADTRVAHPGNPRSVRPARKWIVFRCRPSAAFISEDGDRQFQAASLLRPHRASEPGRGAQACCSFYLA